MGRREGHGRDPSTDLLRVRVICRPYHRLKEPLPHQLQVLIRYLLVYHRVIAFLQENHKSKPGHQQVGNQRTGYREKACRKASFITFAHFPYKWRRVTMTRSARSCLSCCSRAKSTPAGEYRAIRFHSFPIVAYNE